MGFGDPVPGLALHLTIDDLGQLSKPPYCVLGDEKRSDGMISEVLSILKVMNPQI